MEKLHSRAIDGGAVRRAVSARLGDGRERAGRACFFRLYEKLGEIARKRWLLACVLDELCTRGMRVFNFARFGSGFGGRFVPVTHLCAYHCAVDSGISRRADACRTLDYSRLDERARCTRRRGVFNAVSNAVYRVLYATYGRG